MVILESPNNVFHDVHLSSGEMGLWFGGNALGVNIITSTSALGTLYFGILLEQQSTNTIIHAVSVGLSQNAGVTVRAPNVAVTNVLAYNNRYSGVELHRQNTNGCSGSVGHASGAVLAHLAIVGTGNDGYSDCGVDPPPVASGYLVVGGNGDHCLVGNTVYADCNVAPWQTQPRRLVANV